MTIYKIVNLVNGKVYIGQTRQPLKVRMRQHSYSSSNSRGLSGALAKHGIHNFVVVSLFETTSQDILDNKEQFFIKEFNALVPFGYNLTTGGEGGYVRSGVTRMRLSEANKGKSRPHSLDTKNKLSEMKKGSNNPMFGKKQSAETKAKRSKALMGKKRPQEVKDRISAGHQRRKAA